MKNGKHVWVPQVILIVGHPFSSRACLEVNGFGQPSSTYHVANDTSCIAFKTWVLFLLLLLLQRLLQAAPLRYSETGVSCLPDEQILTGPSRDLLSTLEPHDLCILVVMSDAGHWARFF